MQRRRHPQRQPRKRPSATNGGMGDASKDRGAKQAGRSSLREGSGRELKKRPAPSRQAVSPAVQPTRNGNHVGSPHTTTGSGRGAAIWATGSNLRQGVVGDWRETTTLWTSRGGLPASAHRVASRQGSIARQTGTGNLIGRRTEKGAIALHWRRSGHRWWRQGRSSRGPRSCAGNQKRFDPRNRHDPLCSRYSTDIFAHSSTDVRLTALDGSRRSQPQPSVSPESVDP